MKNVENLFLKIEISLSKCECKHKQPFVILRWKSQPWSPMKQRNTSIRGELMSRIGRKFKQL